ncbi:MAG: 4Fe-4S dicluster domain-containing protein [Promethearchaeota archaeon]
MSLPAKVKELKEPSKFVYSLRLLNHERNLEFDNDACVGCGLCVHACPIEGDVITLTGDTREQIVVDVEKCVHCGTCVYFCVSGALKLYIDGEERIELKEPAGDLPRNSLPDFTGTVLKHKDKDLSINKYLAGSLKLPNVIDGKDVDLAINSCPTGALSPKGESLGFDENLCFFCDACSIATGNKIRITRSKLMMDFKDGIPPLIKRILERMMGPLTAGRILKGVNSMKGREKTRMLVESMSK